MNKRKFMQAIAMPALLTTVPALHAQTVDASAVVQQYSAVVFATYEDMVASAATLQKTVQAFVAKPSADGLQAAKKAWLTARDVYGQSEAFRFYGGPIDDEKGPEGRLNSWPIDEAYIDSVKGKSNAGFVNNRKVPLTKGTLIRYNERGGEENISTGWHAIEYMLWGQDFNPAGSGDRSFEDFVDSIAPNADRRRQYLGVVTQLMLDDLRYLLAAWAPASRNYRERFEHGGIESVRKIIVGLGSLSRGELAGERMEVPLNSQDQEDEHSCFSDNTHRDIVNNALGIENVWLGRYVRSDASALQGASLRDLVAAKDKNIAERLSQQIGTSVTAARAIQAPFDREILGNSESAGRKRVQAVIDSLVLQAKDMADAAASLGITRLTLIKPK